MMQTFLPYQSFVKSAQCLDWRRLGNQRNEASIVLSCLVDQREAWSQHPVTRMWRGYEHALTHYRNIIILEWVRRGYKNSLELLPVPDEFDLPPWLGQPRFHDAHKSNLLRKDPTFYGRYGWHVPLNLPYWYPT